METSGRVCPLISLTILNGILSFDCSSLPMVFRAFAWVPAARRTPRASRITTKENTRAIMKKVEPNPSINPTAVVSDVTAAEWLLGIPPVFHMKRYSISRDEKALKRMICMITFRNWAMIQLKKADRKIGLSKRTWKLPSCAGVIAIVVSEYIRFLSRGEGMKTFIAADDDNDRRIDRVIRRFLPHLPLSGIYSAMRKRRILLNGERTTPPVRVRSGDEIAIADSLLSGGEPSVNEERRGVPMPEILFESNTVIAVNKPKNLAVYGKGSLEEAIRAYLLPTLKYSLSFKPGPLHRLDRGTTGLIFYSKNLEGARRFSEILRGRTSEKYYLALLDGRVQEERRLNSPVQGKRALAFLTPLLCSETHTLALVRLVTGRKHQIRIQAKESGHPLTGDTTHGGTRHASGYLLHAYALLLRRYDDILGFRDCRAPLPEASLRRLEKTFDGTGVRKALAAADRFIRDRVQSG